MNEMYIISFNSTHHAIKIEKLLKENNISCTTIPTPREISASCGLSIRFLENNLEIVEEKVIGNDYKGIYKIVKNEDNQKEVIFIK